MKVVVIGGTGLIGSRVVAALTDHGHEAVPASPRLGIDAITGEGLAAALDGAAVVVDVSNSPSFDYATALPFFERSTHNLLATERSAGVGHHVVLSVVGTQELWASGDPTTTTAGYFRAKLTQEDLITASGIPSSIVQKASARSRRTLRLSVTRVSPPVPGSTASSGNSGSATVELPSSASRMWSVASASS